MADREPTKSRQIKSAEPDTPPDTPISTDGVEIALDVEKEDPAPDSSARVLLGKQAKLVDADLEFRGLQCKSEAVRLRSERVSLLLRQLTVLVGICFALGVAAIFVSATRARGVVVEAFDAPPSLAPAGISGLMLAGRIQDELSNIQSRTRTTAVRQRIDNAWTNDVELEVPQTGLSLSELSSILRRSLGNETYLSGSLFLNPDNSLSLVVRGTGIPSKTFSGARGDLDRLVASAADYLFGKFEPRLFAVYLRQAGRIEELEAFVRDASPQATPEVRSALSGALAAALSSQGRTAESLFRARQAVEDDPSNWGAWNSLVSSTRRAQGYEAAWRIGDQIRCVPGSDGEDAISAWYNHKRIVQDWGGQIEFLEWNQRRAGAAGSLTVLAPTLLVDAEAHRHDWSAVSRMLRSSDPADPSLRVTRLYMKGLWLLELDRVSEAAEAMSAFYRLWSNDRSVASQYEFGHCEAAYAMALDRRDAEAFPIFDQGKAFPQCRAYAADILAQRGRHRAADQMYRRAILLAPSVPFAYHRWGLTHLRRGDLDRARAMFEAANARGPRWADPLKGIGDVHAAREEWIAAKRAYGAALEFAPGWQALGAAISEAGTRL